MNLLSHALLRLQTLVGRGAGRQRRATRMPASGDGRRNRFRPSLEPLEERALLSHGLHSPIAPAAMFRPSRLAGDCSAQQSVFHGTYNVTWASTTQIPAFFPRSFRGQPRLFQVQLPMGDDPENPTLGFLSLVGTTTFPFTFHHNGRTLRAVLSLLSINAKIDFHDDPANGAANAFVTNQAGNGPATLFYTVEGGKLGKSNFVNLSGTVTFGGNDPSFGTDGLLSVHYACDVPGGTIQNNGGHFTWTATVMGTIGSEDIKKVLGPKNIKKVHGSWIWTHVNGT
jgi:hypothetical protein